ncbi:ESF1 homolog [Phalacrocorax carbo]|uniref:ESF1 homolog n=1 Tax=Phalacrocorax carbo TaxID=9209 RepID=UPI003119EDF3
MMSKSSPASKMSSQEEILSDGRFSCVTRDPRFWEMPEKKCKIKIDKRFRAMFHDKKFKLKYTVDKRGRPVNFNSTENLRKFYALSESDSDHSEDDSKERTEKKKKEKKAKPKGEADSAKLLAHGVPRKESKTSKQGVDQTHEAVAKLGDLQNEGQKTTSKSNLKENSKKTATEIDCSRGNQGLLPKGESKQRDVSGGRSSSVQNKQKSSQPSGAKSVKASRRDHSLGGKIKESVTVCTDCRDPRDISKSQLEEEISASDDFECAESEEEPEVDRETSQDEKPEDDGETSKEDSDSEDEVSDSGPDLARGIGNIETSSDDDEDLNEVFPKEPEIEHSWRELDKDAPRADEITSRLAVCNTDWDRLKAKDLLALFNSFTPKGGTIFSVKIYPSEFGKERLKEEEQKGPVELFDLPENTTENDGLYREKLREYQFKRLKYFYAVVECDSPETANKIYEECDGLEFESSCSFIDLRKKALSSEQKLLNHNKFWQKLVLSAGACVMGTLGSQCFILKKWHLYTAQSNVWRGDLSEEQQECWELGLKETAEEMVKNRLEGKDSLTPWQKYLEKKKEKRILKKKRKATAERELSEDELPSDVDLNDPYFAEEFEKTDLKKQPELVESTSEDEVEKQKAEMALLMTDDEDDARKHFNYKKIVEQQNLSKKKKKLLMKKKELLEDDFQVNVADRRFQAMFTSPLFNLDPSDPNFKKTKAVEKILEEKARRREQKEQELTEASKGQESKAAKKRDVPKKAIDPALSMLIKSVKSKTEEFQARKKQKMK